MWYQGNIFRSFLEVLTIASEVQQNLEEIFFNTIYTVIHVVSSNVQTHNNVCVTHSQKFNIM